ncbi:MAG TPA: hypothetical protein VNT20_02815 [Flavisolibacter sp.]|jgi:hypothetical protein|nr:hypothetical protein [Flavisolibacter sp.]
MASSKTTTGFYFNLDPDLKRKAKVIAAMDETVPDITSVIHKAVEEFIDKWEKKNGPIPAPKKK